MLAINLRTKLAFVFVSTAACIAMTAPSAAALNPQPLPPGHHIPRTAASAKS